MVMLKADKIPLKFKIGMQRQLIDVWQVLLTLIIIKCPQHLSCVSLHEVLAWKKFIAYRK